LPRVIAVQDDAATPMTDTTDVPGGDPNGRDAIRTAAVDPGLCGRCLHARSVQTARSRFFLCQRSFSDPRYQKYPVLPVQSCPGFEPVTPAE
jgi:hypothetical protein